ncbi:MAG: GGDEF domain-containing protein [Acidobacteriota bacterium]
MAADSPGLLLSEPDAAVIERLAVGERVCLAIAAATALVSAIEWFMPGLRHAFPPAWAPLSGEAWCATVACGIGLYLAHPRFGRKTHKVSMALGALVAAGSTAALIHILVSLLSGTTIAQELHRLQFQVISGMTPQAGLGFLMLGLMIVFLQATEQLGVFADLLCWLMALVILTLSSAQIIGSIDSPDAPFRLYTSHQTMLCLVLLGFVALARRTPHGVLRIVLGRGTGSRVARVLAPILLFLPFLREGIRARLFNFHRMPSHYITALMASIAVGVSYLLLLYLAWRINGLEEEVHELSLRDPLTDLYNLRGFRFLSEQALRMARRSGRPFSLLFIDVDGLKQINDELGHKTGSDFLVQTAEILKENFREADVLGRIGGDEFAVAGQFDEAEILYAAERLREAANLRNATTRYHIPLSFSIGHVTSSPGSRDSLDEMLASADEAMYQVKRQRKTVLR